MAALLAKKTAIVTGGTTGIGRAIALEYLKQGANVAVNHFPDEISSWQYQTLIDEAGPAYYSKLIAIPGDVSKPETGTSIVQTVVSRFGRLDIFVNNAGVCQFHDFLTYVPAFP